MSTKLQLPAVNLGQRQLKEVGRRDMKLLLFAGCHVAAVVPRNLPHNWGSYVGCYRQKLAQGSAG